MGHFGPPWFQILGQNQAKCFCVLRYPYKTSSKNTVHEKKVYYVKYVNYVKYVECINKTNHGEIKIPKLWLPNKKTHIDVKLKDHFYKQFVACDHTVYAQQINFFNFMIKNNVKTTDFPYLSLEDSM